MDFTVPLPHGSQGPYKGNYWAIIERDLGLLCKNSTLARVEETILKHNSRNNTQYNPGLNKLDNLRQLLASDNADLQLVSFVAKVALKLPELFPEKSLTILRKGENKTVELTRKQIACLVANMFFCTFLPNEELANEGIRGHMTGVRAPTGPLTFIYWHRLPSGPTWTYLNSIANYFKDLKEMDSSNLAEKVSFQRLVCHEEENHVWEPKNSNVSIVDVTLHEEGRIGDVEQVEIDFANKNVGFGTTGTQEELILGVSPETTVVVLFTEELRDEEALLITGGKKYGDFTGYGRSVKYTGPFKDNWDWNQRKIVAIDAIPGPTDQLGDRHLRREIRKVWVGMSSVRGLSVSTGHWGCGAFGGNQEIKAIIQIIGASISGVKKLDFYSFGEKVFHEHFKSALEVLREKTVGWLWDRIREFRSKGGVGVCRDSLLEFLTNPKISNIAE